MKDLIARVEAVGADAPSREKRILEALIYQSIGGRAWWSYTQPDGYALIRNEVPHYIASIDAALTLVPHVTQWSLIRDGLRERFIACVNGFVGSASTPALAICAAALKSRL